jgi:Rrf2 family protein
MRSIHGGLQSLDLQLTRRGDYTVRAALSLARTVETGAYRKLREIADEMDIPARYTHEIVSLLVKAGLAEAMAGKQGGYRLVRAPADITLLDVVEAGDGAMRLDRCALSGGPCHWQETICAVHPMLGESVKALTESLRSRSLADVLDLDQRLQAQSRRQSNR